MSAYGVVKPIKNINSSEIYELGLQLGKVVEDLENHTNRWLELSEFA